MLFNQSPCSCFGCYFRYLFFLHILEWFTLFILRKIFIGPQPSLRPPRIIYPYTLSPPETPLCLVSFILLCRNCHFLHIIQFTYLLHSLFISPLSHPPFRLSQRPLLSQEFFFGWLNILNLSRLYAWNCYTDFLNFLFFSFYPEEQEQREIPSRNITCKKSPLSFISPQAFFPVIDLSTFMSLKMTFSNFPVKSWKGSHICTWSGRCLPQLQLISSL